MDDPVMCVIHDFIIDILEPSGLTAFKEAEHCAVLAHMVHVEGAFSLPVSKHGLKLLKEAENAINLGKQWSERRFSDLGRVAEVSSFLCDEVVYNWSVSQLAAQLEHVVHCNNLTAYTPSYDQHDDDSLSNSIHGSHRDPRCRTTTAHACGTADRVTGRAQPALWEQPFDCVSASRQHPAESVLSERVRKVSEVLLQLPSPVQLAVFSSIQLPVCSFMHALPVCLHAALFQRHVHPGHASLDISKQLHAYTWRGVERHALGLLATHLSTLRPLRHLDMSHNRLCAVDAPLVATLVNTHAAQLVTLRLAETFTSSSECPHHACAHTDARNYQETDLHMHGDSAVTSHALQKVISCIARCAALTTLDLSCCQMNSSCMRVLGDTLHALPALQRLDLNDLVPEGSSGSFSTGSFRRLCSSLPGLKHLSHLSLNSSGLSAHFQLLARALQHMHALRHVDVGGNVPDIHSLACFIAAAAHAPQLHALCLDSLVVSCSTEWYFTLQLLQQCASAFFQVVGVSSSSLNCSSYQILPCDSSDAFQPDMHGILAPATPRLSPHASQVGSDVHSYPGMESRIRSMHGNDACVNSNSACARHALAHFKTLSLKNLTIEGLAVPSLLHMAVLDLAWGNAAAGLPELQEATPTMHAHAWRLTDTLQGLTKLNLSNTDFEGFWNTSQCEFIASLHALRDLRLARCNLPSTALTSLCMALRSVQSTERRYVGLIALDWRENPVRGEAFEPLCGLTTLQRLRLQGCGLRKQQELALCMHATRLGALTWLELGFFGNSAEPAGAAGAA